MGDEGTVPSLDYDPLTVVGPCTLCSKELTNSDLLSMLLKCVNFAALKHKHQRRKDEKETPYINHPIGLLFLKKIISV